MIGSQVAEEMMIDVCLKTNVHNHSVCYKKKQEVFMHALIVEVTARVQESLYVISLGLNLQVAFAFPKWL